MKLISLNTWGGKIYNPLINFIKDNSHTTDIFCFQEVFNTTSDITEHSGFRINIYSEITGILENHQGYFAPTLDNYIVGAFQPNFTNFNLSSGLAIFIKNNIKVLSHGDFYFYGNRDSFNPKDLNSLPRNVQYLNFTDHSKLFTLCNLHGIWIKGSKGDIHSRIQQSNQIKNFLDQQEGEKILVGDFNLDINTESIKILESSMINLIKKYHISTTRSPLFPGSDKFADYMFVSKKIKVIDFQVPNLEVSDHLPMTLEFS